MRSGIVHPLALLTFELIAFWPVWRWYVLRLSRSADESYALVALFTGIALVLLTMPSKKERTGDVKLLVPIVFLLLYVCSFHFSPPLMRAVFASLALGSTLCAIRDCRRGSLGLVGIFLLALPVIPTAQFYAGYPLRVLVAEISIPLLNVGGLGVEREGACLLWNGNLISIDAPCSGVQMMWACLYLTCVLSVLFRLGTSKTILASLFAVGVVVLANSLRASALFYVESGIIFLPQIAHDAIGMAVFIFAALAVTWKTYVSQETQYV